MLGTAWLKRRGRSITKYEEIRVTAGDQITGFLDFKPELRRIWTMLCCGTSGSYWDFVLINPVLSLWPEKGSFFGVEDLVFPFRNQGRTVTQVGLAPAV